VATVLLAPYLTAVATEAACPGLADEATCTTDLQVLGLPISPGSLVFYAATFSTILSALLPAVRRRRRRPLSSAEDDPRRLRLGRRASPQAACGSCRAPTGSSASCC
jgi:hypothetical protein